VSRLSPEDRKLYYEQWVLPQKAERMTRIQKFLKKNLGCISREKVNNFFFLCIAGAIGVGKSTFTRIFSPLIEAEPYYEELPKFIGRFYKAMDGFEQAVVKMIRKPSRRNKKRFRRIQKITQELSFRLQIWFLHKRFDCHSAIVKNNHNAVQDRSIYEDVLFALLLYMEGKMGYSQLKTYLNGFAAHTKNLNAPTAILYLYADMETLMFRIHKRARDIESALSPFYEQELVNLYELAYQFYPCPIIMINVCGEVDLTSVVHNAWKELFIRVWPIITKLRDNVIEHNFYRLEIDFREELGQSPLVASLKNNGNGSKGDDKLVIISNHDFDYGDLDKPLCKQTIKCLP
jgi:deoxyadenosine/deoxycytidine kinase